MAKNYTLAEAVEIIAKGTDKEQMLEIGKRFPLLSMKIAVVASLAGDAFVDLMGYMPEHLTANKVNTAIKNGVETSGSEEPEAEAEEETAEETAKEKKPSKKTEAKAEGSDYEAMTGNQLVELCKERGLWKGLKNKKKDGMIAALKAADNGSEETTEESEETTEESAYAGKSAMELFKECKKRGLKVEPKKPAKFYEELLVKNDAEAAEEAEAEEDGWDDEEEETKPEPKKTAKAEKKKPAKKEEPKQEAEEEEDDDWDI